MQTVDLNEMEGRRFPAGRATRNIAGGRSPIQAAHFCAGLVVLDPDGGQVPWHNHPQEEVYFLLEGEAEMCIDGERQVLRAGQAVFIPPNAFHQLTNIGSEPARMIYTYGPAGDVDHWKQELEGTLPRAGEEAPPLPEGSRAQRL